MSLMTFLSPQIAPRAVKITVAVAIYSAVETEGGVKSAKAGSAERPTTNTNPNPKYFLIPFHPPSSPKFMNG
jgi:hypothetical protein